MIGMRITLGTESNELEAVMEFKRLAKEQGFQWEAGTERAYFYEFARGEPINKLVATKIEETFFKSTVKEYTHIQERPVIGKTYTVSAQEKPQPLKYDIPNEGYWYETSDIPRR